MMDVTTLSVGALIFFFIVMLALLAFWIWMFADMLGSRMQKMTKGIWAVLFVFTYIAAIVWFFVRPKRRRR